MPFTVRRLADDKKPRFKIPAWLTIRVVRLLQGLRRKHAEEKEASNRILMFKRLLVILLALLCAVAVASAAVQTLVQVKILSVQNVATITASPLPVDTYDHTNVLLLGEGDKTHDGLDLTDSIMVASIDAKTKGVALLSLPRDLYFLKTNRMGAGRINTLYRDYKGLLVSQSMKRPEASKAAMAEIGLEVGSALGLEIHHIIKVDFSGFTQLVDAIGGVDIDVPQDLTDPEYPGTEDSYETFTLLAGPQHLDGETALKYARSRHSTSDFDRSRRQQQILSAVSAQAKNSGLLTHPSKILQLLGILTGHMETTLTVREMVGLADIARGIDRSHIAMLQLNDENGLYDVPLRAGGFLYAPPRDQFEGASVLLPVSIPEFPVTWKQIRVLAQLFLNDRTVETTPAITVLNAGAKEGSGRKLSGELTRYGFAIEDVRNATRNEQRATSVMNAPAAEQPRALPLANLLKIPFEPSESGSGLTILLGKNYSYTPLQALLTPPQ